jgi:hypothetical protein
VPKQPPKARIPDLNQVLAPIIKDAQAAAAEGVRALAERVRDGFKLRIEAQHFPSFKARPLSAYTIARKTALGLPLDTMIATGTYLNAIKVYEEESTKGVMRWSVTIHAKDKAMDAETGAMRPEVPLQMVAYIQENGCKSANIPPRPHWGPFYDELLLQMPKEAKTIMKLVQTRISHRIAQS